MSDVLDVAIGLVLAWFLLSLAVSAVNESIAWLLRARAKVLWRALGRLFTDVDLTGKFSSLVLKLPDSADVLAHTGTPGVTSTADPKLQEFHDRLSGRVPDPGVKRGKTRISNIPAEVVSDTVQSMAAATVTKASLLAVIHDGEPLREVVDEHLAAATPLDEATATAQIPVEHRTAFAHAWQRAERVITVEDLAAVVAGNEALADRITLAVAGLADGEKVRAARQEIERWFNGAMEGAGRIYRRQNRKIAAAIALPIVFLANTDSIGLLSRLREDRDLRAAAATAAAEWAAEPLARDESGAIDLTAVCDRIADVDDGEDAEAADTTAVTEPADATTEPDPVEEARRRYKCAGDLFASSDLIGPVGPGPLWDEIRESNDSDVVFRDLWSFTFGGSGFIGRLLTWAALLFGASFWYDVLRRFVGLKGKAASSAERS